MREFKRFVVLALVFSVSIMALSGCGSREVRIEQPEDLTPEQQQMQEQMMQMQQQMMDQMRQQQEMIMQQAPQMPQE